MSELIQLISEVGFPIFVRAFVLARLEDKLDSLHVPIEKLP